MIEKHQPSIPDGERSVEEEDEEDIDVPMLDLSKLDVPDVEALIAIYMVVVTKLLASDAAATMSENDRRELFVLGELARGVFDDCDIGATAMRYAIGEKVLSAGVSAALEKTLFKLGIGEKPPSDPLDGEERVRDVRMKHVFADLIIMWDNLGWKARGLTTGYFNSVTWMVRIIREHLVLIILDLKSRGPFACSTMFGKNDPMVNVLPTANDDVHSAARFVTLIQSLLEEMVERNAFEILPTEQLKTDADLRDQRRTPTAYTILHTATVEENGTLGDAFQDLIMLPSEMKDFSKQETLYELVDRGFKIVRDLPLADGGRLSDEDKQERNNFIEQEAGRWIEKLETQREQIEEKRDRGEPLSRNELAHLLHTDQALVNLRLCKDGTISAPEEAGRLHVQGDGAPARTLRGHPHVIALPMPWHKRNNALGNFLHTYRHVGLLSYVKRIGRTTPMKWNFFFAVGAVRQVLREVQALHTALVMELIYSFVGSTMEGAAIDPESGRVAFGERERDGNGDGDDMESSAGGSGQHRARALRATALNIADYAIELSNSKPTAALWLNLLFDLDVMQQLKDSVELDDFPM